VLARIGRTRAILLLAAAVVAGLVAGGYVAWSAGDRSSPAPVGSWTAAAPLAVPEVSQAAVVLSDGDVLMTGGEDKAGGRPTGVVQRYRAATGKWSAVAAMRHDRIGHTVTLLADGRVLAVGGLGAKLQPLSSVEIYDPARNRWAETAPLPDVRFSQSATLLADGRVLVVGGIVHGAISRSVPSSIPARGCGRPGRRRSPRTRSRPRSRSPTGAS
jgi:N-acetylneuraminic acid mutarotase